LLTDCCENILHCFVWIEMYIPLKFIPKDTFLFLSAVCWPFDLFFFSSYFGLYVYNITYLFLYLKRVLTYFLSDLHQFDLYLFLELYYFTVNLQEDKKKSKCISKRFLSVRIYWRALSLFFYLYFFYCILLWIYTHTIKYYIFEGNTWLKKCDYV